jgi:hypothetical protein
LRQTVYEGVQNKSMEWFDLGMGMKNDEADEESETVGAGGLMAKFTRSVRRSLTLSHADTLVEKRTMCELACRKPSG